MLYRYNDLQKQSDICLSKMFKRERYTDDDIYEIIKTEEVDVNEYRDDFLEPYYTHKDQDITLKGINTGNVVTYSRGVFLNMFEEVR